MRSRSRLAALLPALAAGVIAAPAIGDDKGDDRADDRADDRGDESGRAPLLETDHRVTITIEDGNARLRVARSFRNRAATAQSFALDIPLPAGSTVDRFAVRGERDWIEGRVLTADAASAAFDALVDDAGDNPKADAARRPLTVAILRGWARDTASLEIPSLGPSQRLSIRYDIVAPTCFGSDRLFVAYPTARSEFGFALAPPRVAGRGLTIATSADPLLPPEIEGFDQAGCHSSHGPADDANVIVASLAAPRRPVLRWGTTLVGNRELARLELDLPGKLRAVPRRANLVFVFDASHSLGDRALEGQLALARGLAAQFPSATVQLVAFRRRAAALLPGFVPLRSLEAAIAKLSPSALALGNGSHLDAGVALAAELVAKRAGPTRVFVFTDSRMRQAFSAEATAKVLAALSEAKKRDAIVHVIDYAPSTNPLTEETASDHSLAPIARATGGATLLLSGTHASPSDNRLVTAHLVSPTRIEGFSIEAGGLALIEERTVPLGTGFRRFAVGERAPHGVTVRGLLWTQPWALHATRSAALSELTGPLAVAAWVSELEDAERTELAITGGVISTFSSLLASTGERTSRPLNVSGGSFASGST